MGDEMKRWQGLAVSIFLLIGVEGAMLYLDSPAVAAQQGVHGGQVRVIQPYAFELLVANGQLQVWVADPKGRPVSPTEVSAKAIVITGPPVATPYVLELSAGSDHLVARDSRITPANDMRVMLNTTIKGETLFVKYWDVPPTGNVCVGV